MMRGMVARPRDTVQLAMCGRSSSPQTGAVFRVRATPGSGPALLFAALLAFTLALVLTLTCAFAPLIPAAAAASGQGNNPLEDQGSNYHYRSLITDVTPNVPGLSLEILEFADRLLLVNHTGETVTVYGYQGEPYARVLANGTAERNVRSPATYLNESFYGDITIPPVANPGAPPKWEVIDRTGQFEWHDHRIHWPSPSIPPQVKDQGKRTLIFDWQIPIEIGAQKGEIAGQLYWEPERSSAPTAVIVLGGAIVVLGGLFVLVVRRRRRQRADGGHVVAKDSW